LVHTTPQMIWHDVRTWGIEGKGWPDTEHYFDRLPAAARDRVRPPVWDLSRHSAGMCTRFITDAQVIHVRYTLLNERLAMPHMPATGVSGVDLYAEHPDGTHGWVAVSQPTEQKVETIIAQNLKPGARLYTLYLPLYNGVKSLEIGVAHHAICNPVSPRSEKPILFYGTSITHGACASRPGMAFPAILGRWLNKPVINLGFSGNGQMEEAITACLTDLDVSLYIIDCLPNMTPDLIAERTAPLVHQLRAAKPETPILLVEDRSYTNAAFLPQLNEQNQLRRQALRKAYMSLKEEGVHALHYMQGDDILGQDGEAATDGSHPNDLGMLRYARAYQPLLQTILNAP
jgi:lysophospholipase L1-like esterase